MSNKKLRGGSPLPERINDPMTSGYIEKLSDAAIAINSLVKIGASSTTVAICGAGDNPIGIARNAATGAGQTVLIQLLGAGAGTSLVHTSGAVAQGALLEPDASGAVKTLSPAVGLHQVVGRALEAAAGVATISADHFYFIREI